jgi:ABC-type antimicrobial peptide transport system permease subunit
VPGFKSLPPFRLQALKDLHFDSRYSSYFGNPQAHKPTLYGLALVACSLLMLGIINFVTLTTAQGEQRFKEVWIRRTIGGSRRAIFFTFFTETVIIVLCSLLLSTALTPLAIHVYQDYLPSAISFSMIGTTSGLIFLISLFAVTVLLSGIYLSWQLSGKNRLLTARGQKTKLDSHSGERIRKGLVWFQFVVSQAFVIATVFVGMQLRFSLDKDRGFKDDGVFAISLNPRDTVESNKQYLREKLEEVPGIKSVSFANAPIASNLVWSAKVNFTSENGIYNLEVQQKFADSNYTSLFGIPLKTGRNLSGSSPMKECLVNETFARAVGFTQFNNLIGRTITLGDTKTIVAGVIADFHYQSLHDIIRPLMICYNPANVQVVNLALQLKNGKTETSLSSLSTRIQSVFKEIYPSEEFKMESQHEAIEKFYSDDRKLSFLLKSITWITIFVSCIGLFGLTLYSTQRRQKEISIRKLLGATVSQIVRLFTKEFLALVAIAFLTAAPITYLIVDDWLNNFSYRIAMSWWLFAIAGLVSAIIVVATISLQSIKIALSNPAQVLKSE